MPENNKPSKDKRQERQQQKVEKFTKERESEAKQAGIDTDKTISVGPLGEDRKKQIDETISKGVSDDMKVGLEKIQALRTPPKVDVPGKPDKPEYTIDDVRKQRRAKFADILNSFAQGAVGLEVTPRAFRDRLKDERLAQFEQYKGASKAAKQKLQEWETAYITEQLDYLKAQRDDPNISDLKRQALQRQIEKTEAEIKYKNEQTRLLGTDKEGKDDKEETAKYVTKLDDDNTITKNIPLNEAQRLEQEAKIKEATQVINAELQEAKLELADMGTEGTRRREFIDRPKRDNIEAKIAGLEQQKQEIIDSFGIDATAPEPKPKPEPKPDEAKEKTILQQEIENAKANN